GDGWDDFDFDVETAVKADAGLDAEAEDEGGDGWANDLDLGDAGLTLGDTGGPQVFDMAMDDDLAQDVEMQEATMNGDEKAPMDALQARIAELEGQLVQTQDVAWQFPIIVWALAERESTLKAQAAVEQLQQEVQRLRAEAAEAEHRTTCCVQVTPDCRKKAQIAAAAQDAAGSAELQEEVNRLKSEIAQVPELQAAAEKLQLEVERLTAEAVE
ncbi:unnamed protein product, partial [Symbiodinium sp. KB8]